MYGSVPCGARGPVYQQIDAIAQLLPAMDRLISFFLILEQRSESHIPQRSITRLVEDLPISCTSLELDTHANDDRNNDYHGTPSHVCTALRRIMPRIQHVRLRIGAMCASMFGTGHIERMQIGEGEYPFLRLTGHVPLSNMKTLVISCGH